MPVIHRPPGPVAKNLLRILSRRRLKPTPLSTQAGVGESYIRNILSGKSQHPRHDGIRKLAQALGCSEHDLTREDEEPPDTEEEGLTRSDLLQHAYMIARRALRDRPLPDPEATAARYAAFIYDVLLEAEKEGRPISADNEEACALIVAMVRRFVLEP